MNLTLRTFTSIIILISVVGSVYIPSADVYPVRCGLSNGARMVRGKVSYMLGEYVEIERITSFSFPASETNCHAGAYLWIKDLIKNRVLPKGLNSVYLDTHPDWEPEYDRLIISSNWVGVLLRQKDWINNAYYVFPPWFSNENRRVMENFISLNNTQITSVESVNLLPSGEELGPIILSIDLDYFSNNDEENIFNYKPGSVEAIKEMVDEIICSLKEKNIKIAALNFSISPNDTYAEDIPTIRVLLKEAFKGYDEWLQNGEQP